ncbi:MAG: 4Fe-4S binding protein, partial [Candidatus Lokiarchaeota archaeon]|nr:4Fe-4S binding protein [Candidatus Lokiarchaeota archaeon]
GKYEIYEPERCTECSACKRNCPTMAIVLQEKKGCGCLWNARYVAKNPQNNSCCG